MSIRILVVAAALAAAASTAVAHHSGAMFDDKKEVTLEGVIRQVQFTNPHTWIQVFVPDAAGNRVEWSIEGSAPTVMVRGGFTKNSLKPGDKVTVKAHPMRDGRPAGGLVSIKTASGEVLPRGRSE